MGGESLALGRRSCGIGGVALAVSCKKRAGWVALLGFLAVGMVVRVGAQTSVDGAVRGTIYDATGAAVAGAAVRVRSAATGFDLEETTGSSGEFVAVRVPPGDYEVSVRATGFAPADLVRVAVRIGGVAEVGAHLKLIGPRTTVTVNAAIENATLEDGVEDSSASALSLVFAQDLLEELPVKGRRWQDFALLNGVVGEDPSGDGLLSFRGLPATQNSTTVDGVSDDQSFGAVPRGTGAETGGDVVEEEREGGFSSAAGRSRAFGTGAGRRVGASYTFSQEAVREFRVSVQNYAAGVGMGHGAGGIISTVSKSGTNTLHGAGFYLVRQSAWGATNPFSIATSYANGLVTSDAVKPQDLRQQFGGSIGGAAVRDRLFYFYTLDLLRRGYPAVSSPGYAGFYALTATQSTLLGNRGVTRTRINAALNYLSSLTGSVPRSQNQNVNFMKLDWQAGPRNRLSVEYNRARMEAPAGARAGATVDRGRASLGDSHVTVDAPMGRWLWLLNARTNNEVRLHYGHELVFETAQVPLAQEQAIGPDGLAPQVSIGPEGLIFGTPASLGRKAYPDERRIGASDLLTWSRGRHLVQMGAEFTAVHDEVSALNNVEGSFSYDSGSTRGKAGGLVDWITDYTFDVHAYPNGGCPSIVSAVHDFCFRSFTQSFGQQAVAFATQEWAGFIEDSWRVRQGLSLKAGMRYEYELLPFPQQPNGALDAVFGARGATSVFPEDRNNLGLRLGAAWEPFGPGHGVIRAGYGQYFGRLAGTTIRSALVNTALPASTTHIRVTPTTVTACPQVANQGFGYGCTYVVAPPSAVASTTSATVFDVGFRLPAVQQGSVSIERSIGLGATLSATYLMNLDRQLANSVDLNIAPSTGRKIFEISGGTAIPGVRNGDTFSLPVYSQRVSAKYGPVTAIESNGNATYNAMVLEAQRRSRGGFTFRVAWTWSKALDYGEGGAVPRTNGQFDPFDLAYDRGLSSFNRSHRIVASAVWEPHLSTSQRWVRRSVSGWVVAPVFTAASGRPYSYNIFGGTNLSGGRESINGAGGAIYLPSVGRNTLRLPETANVDLRVSRGVRLRERVWLRGMVEVFNVANHRNLSAVTERAFLVGETAGGMTPLIFQDAVTVAAEGLNVRAFGAPTAAGTEQARERQVQLGLRLEF
jgi:hypothetical protein